MHEYPTPAQLHQRAMKVWPAGLEWDARSSLLRSIEAELVAGVSELRPKEERRAANWISALHRHEQFWRDRERSPREKTRNLATLPDGERWLGEWGRYQRRTKLLVRYQMIRLDVSPSFSWDPQESAWIANYDACARHRRMNGSLPRLTSADRDEFVLARWLGRQLGQLRAGTASADRARLLLDLLSDHNNRKRTSAR
jgi:hypothetical protein